MILCGLYLIMHGRCLRAVGGGGEESWWWTEGGLSAPLKAAKDFFDTWQLDLPSQDKNYSQKIMHHYCSKIGQITRLL